MKILCTCKLLRTTRRIRIRNPFVRHTSLAQQTRNFPPPVHLSVNAKHREYFPRCFPPSPVPPPTALGHTQHRALSCLPSSCLCLHYIYCFFPLFSRQTPRPTPLLPSTTTVLMTPPSCQSNQASPPPLDHQISPILLSTACIRVVQHVTISIDPILLHSLSLLLQLLIPYPQS